MNQLKNLSILILILTMFTSKAQELKPHQWRNRLILIMTDDISNETYQKQISELQTNENGLKERKLIVYQVQDGKFKKDFSSKEWKQSSNLYETYNKTNSGFEVVLIGLDGGVKLRQSKFISCKELFSIIDVMPMRRNEMKKKD